LAGFGVTTEEIIRIYHIETPERLRVVRILHGSRDVRKILRKEKPVRD
jgi:plasmid stabilization system protein ParE